MKQNKKSWAVTAAVVVFAAVIFAVSAVTWKSIMYTLYPIKYDDFVIKYSESYGVDKELIYAVINTESSFEPEARSEVGALGLMQIMPETFDWICSKTGDELEFDALKDPETSVRCGTFMLKYLLDEFGSAEEALAAYHAGRGKVNEWLDSSEYSKDGKTLDKIPYRDTAHYVSKVTRAVNIYKNLYS